MVSAIVFDLGGVLIDLDFDSCVRSFREVLGYERITELLERLAEKYAIYGLTNNNEISVERMHKIYEENGLDWQRVFRKEFISCRMQLMKPSREIFDAAAAEIGFPPEEILFVDDSQKNVDGALAAGWQAALYVQGTDLGACLANYL